MEEGALVTALLASLGVNLLALFGLMRPFVRRNTRRAVMALRDHREQITPESLKAHCEPILRARLHAIRQTAPRVQAISMKIDLASYDGGWVPRAVPYPVLWLEPRYDRGPEDMEVDDAEWELVKDVRLTGQLVGHIRPEQLTLAAIHGGHRLVVRVGCD